MNLINFHFDPSGVSSLVLAQGQAGEDALTNRVVQFLKDKEGDAVGEL